MVLTKRSDEKFLRYASYHNMCKVAGLRFFCVEMIGGRKILAADRHFPFLHNDNSLLNNLAPQNHEQRPIDQNKKTDPANESNDNITNEREIT